MARRRIEDRTLTFATRCAAAAELKALSPIASLTQPIHDAPRVAEKRANLEKAIGLMNGLMIAPGEVFSFWAVMGEPSAACGWRAGRTIINDIVSADAGGGLCQLSGLVHHLGVLAGLTVSERWPHSADLYEEHQRFMPLGLDATVVYGFKDLRLRHDGAGPVWLSFGLAPHAITGVLMAQEPGAPCTVELDRRDGAGERAVTATRVWPDGRREVLSQDRYRV
jgi:vancomycin resistance protein VanW